MSKQSIDIEVNLINCEQFKRRLQAIRDGVDIILKGFDEADSEEILIECGINARSLSEKQLETLANHLLERVRLSNRRPTFA